MDELSDKIANKVYEKYNSLGKKGKPIENTEWTLLASFLLEEEGNIEVVSLATGTKCIGSKAMCPDGLIVNDSHAEVLARRAFLKYLYSEVVKVKLNGKSHIFSGLNLNGKCLLKETVKYYFFSSHVPCGDGSIIPMKRGLKRRHEEINDGQDSLTDIHRTGAKPVTCESRQDPHGSGENYHIRGAVRIKPGRGDPTLSLSCSDKIARWIYVGLQGALLSQLIENAIRISLIVIGGGSQYCKEVLEEALITRSGSLYKPTISQSNLIFKHSQIATDCNRPCPTSIIWMNIENQKPQVSVEGRLLGSTKKCKSKSLLICKREFFKNFLFINKEQELNLTYRQTKDLSEDYQNQCKEFKKAMGAWSVCKRERELFRISKEEL